MINSIYHDFYVLKHLYIENHAVWIFFNYRSSGVICLQMIITFTVINV